MQPLYTFLTLIVLSTFFVSCGGFDPAEKLAYQIEEKAHELEKSENTKLTFDFVPNAISVKKAPQFTGDVIVRVFPHMVVKGSDTNSTIAVSEWYGTTYHSRFVKVLKEMKQSKRQGEPFQIILEKSGDTIIWTSLE